VSGGRAARGCGGCETDGSAAPGTGRRTARCHRNFDAADTDAYENANLEKLETNGTAACVGKGRVMQPDPPQGEISALGSVTEQTCTLRVTRRSRCIRRPAEFGNSSALDAGLLAGTQAVEHYEMSRYGTIKAMGGQLGMNNAAKLLDETLQEERKADQAVVADC
jgi:hypothetical protein